MQHESIKPPSNPAFVSVLDFADAPALHILFSNAMTSNMLTHWNRVATYFRAANCQSMQYICTCPLLCNNAYRGPFLASTQSGAIRVLYEQRFQTRHGNVFQGPFTPDDRALDSLSDELRQYSVGLSHRCCISLTDKCGLLLRAVIP